MTETLRTPRRLRDLIGYAAKGSALPDRLVIDTVEHNSPGVAALPYPLVADQWASNTYWMLPAAMFSPLLDSVDVVPPWADLTSGVVNVDGRDPARANWTWNATPDAHPINDLFARLGRRGPYAPLGPLVVAGRPALALVSLADVPTDSRYARLYETPDGDPVALRADYVDAVAYAAAVILAADVGRRRQSRSGPVDLLPLSSGAPLDPVVFTATGFGGSARYIVGIVMPVRL